jgi:hypothetical protein
MATCPVESEEQPPLTCSESLVIPAKSIVSESIDEHVLPVPRMASQNIIHQHMFWMYEDPAQTTQKVTNYRKFVV